LSELQAVNYSFNFLLYCAVNVAFRRRFTGARELHRVGAASGELLRAVSGAFRRRFS